MAPFIYPSSDAPRYIRGNAVSLTMVGMATVIYGGMWFWFDRENKRRAGGDVKAHHRALSDEARAELGDESPHFVYTI
jgi:hypothetical protein